MMLKPASASIADRPLASIRAGNFISDDALTIAGAASSVDTPSKNDRFDSMAHLQIGDVT